MRRRALLVSSILLLGGGAAVLALAEQSASHRSLRVLYVAGRPLRLGQRQSTALTILSQPNPSKAGQPVTISGRAYGSPSAGIPIELWTRLSGRRRFHATQTTHTDAQGRYAITLGAGQVDVNRQWYVSTARAQSPVITQTVNALVSLSSSDQLPVPGEPVRLTGEVFPGAGADQVQLQRHVPDGGGWKTIGRAGLRGSSTFRFVKRFTPGRISLRALVPATSAMAPRPLRSSNSTCSRSTGSGTW